MKNDKGSCSFHIHLISIIAVVIVNVCTITRYINVVWQSSARSSGCCYKRIKVKSIWVKLQQLYPNKTNSLLLHLEYVLTAWIYYHIPSGHSSRYLDASNRHDWVLSLQTWHLDMKTMVSKDYIGNILRLLPYTNSKTVKKAKTDSMGIVVIVLQETLFCLKGSVSHRLSVLICLGGLCSVISGCIMSMDYNLLPIVLHHLRFSYLHRISVPSRAKYFVSNQNIHNTDVNFLHGQTWPIKCLQSRASLQWCRISNKPSFETEEIPRSSSPAFITDSY